MRGSCVGVKFVGMLNSKSSAPKVDPTIRKVFRKYLSQLNVWDTYGKLRPKTRLSEKVLTGPSRLGEADWTHQAARAAGAFTFLSEELHANHWLDWTRFQGCAANEGEMRA